MPLHKQMAGCIFIYSLFVCLLFYAPDIGGACQNGITDACGGVPWTDSTFHNVSST